MKYLLDCARPNMQKLSASLIGFMLNRYEVELTSEEGRVTYGDIRSRDC